MKNDNNIQIESQKTGNLTKENIEISISQLKSVLFVRVEFNEDGFISEIHAVSDTSRAVKQVVRDIESVLAAKYGIRVNHNIISVALINDENASAPVIEKRLAYEELVTSAKREEFECRVTLSYEGIPYTGEAGGAALTRERVIADATVEAIHRFIGFDKLLNVVEIKNIQLAGENIYIIMVSFVLGGKAQYRTGTATIEKDPHLSVVKATLDAVNRSLPVLQKTVQ